MAKPKRKEKKGERVADQTPDMREELLGQIRAVAPEAFTEGRLDLEKLTQLTGDAAEGQSERFSFTWTGKRDAVAMRGIASHAGRRPKNSDVTRTLRPRRPPSRRRAPAP